LREKLKATVVFVEETKGKTRIFVRISDEYDRLISDDLLTFPKDKYPKREDIEKVIDEELRKLLEEWRKRLIERKEEPSWIVGREVRK